MSIYLNSNVADLTPVVINNYPCFFFFHQLTDFRSLVIEMFMNIAMSSKKNP